jgi:hypothetical protein
MMRRITAVLLALLCLMAVTACGGGGGDDAEGGSNGDERAESSSSDDDQMEIDEPEESDVHLDGDDIIEILQDFWDDHEDEVGIDFRDVPEDRQRSIYDDDLPSCNGGPLPVEDLVGNAAAINCGEAPTVVWDPDYLEAREEAYGQAGPAVTLSHEFGHVIQIEQGLFDQDIASVYLENQADCYAGAFIAEQIDEEVEPFTNADTLDNAMAARVSSADPVGYDPNALDAHGSGFDRVRAFQDGVNQGVEYCNGYLEDPPFIDEIPFGNAEDQANEGNLPFDDVVDLVVDDLGWYFDENVDDFEEPDDPFELVDEDDLEELHAEIGDGVVPTVLGLTWAQAAQEATDEDTDGEGAFLQRACVVGAWLGDILHDQQDETERPSGAQLSPGDLDEAIATMVRLSQGEMAEGNSAFEAVFDMRQGVFGSLDDCRLD